MPSASPDDLTALQTLAIHLKDSANDASVNTQLRALQALQHFSGTFALAKLTPTGTQGSITIMNGLITNFKAGT
jgi:hypothetical protein